MLILRLIATLGFPQSFSGGLSLLTMCWGKAAKVFCFVKNQRQSLWFQGIKFNLISNVQKSSWMLYPATTSHNHTQPPPPHTTKDYFFLHLNMVVCFNVNYLVTHTVTKT